MSSASQAVTSITHLPMAAQLAAMLVLGLVFAAGHAKFKRSKHLRERWQKALWVLAVIVSGRVAFGAASFNRSIAERNRCLDNLAIQLNSGFLKFYDSTGTGRPATPDTAITTQVLLATVTFPVTFKSTTAIGVLTAAAIASITIATSGTTTWARAFDSGGTNVLFDINCGTSAADAVLNSAALSSGATLSISSMSISQAA